MTVAYAELRKNKDGQCFYQIYFEKPSETPYAWKGPYRDETDAENAAEDEAKLSNLDLYWRR